MNDELKFNKMVRSCRVYMLRVYLAGSTNKIPYRSPDLYKYVTDIVLDIIPRDSDLELKTGDSKPLGSGLESPKVKPRLNSTLQLFLCAVSV